MNETHGFSKHYNVCINEISFHLRVVFGYVAKSLIKSLKVSDQWRAEVWWCAGRLLDCIPTNKFWYWAAAYGGHCYWICAACKS